jgi:hypothetical protein
MRRVVDETRRTLWGERLARFALGGLTVAAFCSAEGVSVPTFYEWKRKLAPSAARGRKRRLGASASGNRPAASPAKSAASPAKSAASPAKSAVSQRGAFLPVRIEGVTSVDGASLHSKGLATARPETARVQIELPNGARVCVPAAELGALTAAIAAAGRVPMQGEAEASPC